MSNERKTGFRTIANRNSHIKISTSHIAHNLRKFLTNKKYVMDEWPTWQYDISKGQYFKYQLRLSEVEIADPNTNVLDNKKLMAEFASEMNDLTVDVFNILTHLYITKDKDEDNFVEISTDDILFLRNIKSRKNSKSRLGTYKQELREKINRHIEILSKVYLEEGILNDYQYCRGKKRQFFKDERILIVEKIPKSYYWKIKLGEVLQYDLAKRICFLNFKVLTYNPHKEFLEKRLGNYFVRIARIRAKDDSYCDPITIKIIFNEIGIDYKRPERVRENFQNALDRLIKDKVIEKYESKDLERYERLYLYAEEFKGSISSNYNKQQYLNALECLLQIIENRHLGEYEEYINEDKDFLKQFENYKELKDYLKISNWLNYKIAIYPDPIIIKSFRGQINPLFKYNNKKSPKIYTNILIAINRLKKYKREKNLTLKQLSEETDISTYSLSRYLNNKNNFRYANLNKLKLFFKKNPVEDLMKKNMPDDSSYKSRNASIL